MKPFCLAVALLASAGFATEARAQVEVVKFTTLGPGSVSKSVSVAGTVDLKVATNCSKVYVYAFTEGSKKPKLGVELVVGTDGKWGTPTNVFPPDGAAGGSVTVLVEAIDGTTIYARTGKSLSKK